MAVIDLRPKNPQAVSQSLLGLAGQFSQASSRKEAAATRDAGAERRHHESRTDATALQAQKTNARQQSDVFKAVYGSGGTAERIIKNNQIIQLDETDFAREGRTNEQIQAENAGLKSTQESAMLFFKSIGGTDQQQRNMDAQVVDKVRVGDAALGNAENMAQLIHKRVSDPAKRQEAMGLLQGQTDQMAPQAGISIQDIDTRLNGKKIVGKKPGTINNEKRDAEKARTNSLKTATEGKSAIEVLGNIMGEELVDPEGLTLPSSSETPATVDTQSNVEKPQSLFGRVASYFADSSVATPFGGSVSRNANKGSSKSQAILGILGKLDEDQREEAKKLAESGNDVAIESLHKQLVDLGVL